MYIKRHFFVPHNFVGGPSGIIATVTSLGWVIFAKESQFVVVKGGLE